LGGLGWVGGGWQPPAAALRSVRNTSHATGPSLLLGPSLAVEVPTLRAPGSLWGTIGGLWCSLGSFWAPFGGLWCPLGSFWWSLVPFGLLWAVFGALWAAFGGLWCPLGSFWIAFGRLWPDFGFILAPLGCPWAPFRRPLGSFGRLWAPFLGSVGTVKNVAPFARKHTF
jgi:hypothetical protein